MIGTVMGEAGQPVTVEGYAQDFGCPVTAVQFSCDDGGTWTTYDTPDADDNRNVNWAFTFTPPRSGRYELLVRAVSADGRATPQPARVAVDVAPTR